jgi:hypothetical protein
MKILLPVSLATAVALSGCASYDGRGLEAGKASEADVLRVMGTPDDTLKRPNGDKTLYFSRQPEGRQIYAATVGADGSLRGIDPLLVPDNIRKVAAGSSSRAEVRELLGPPSRAARAPFKPLDVWEYRWQIGADRRVLWIGFSDDGVAREVTDMHDFEFEPNTGQGKD